MTNQCLDFSTKMSDTVKYNITVELFDEIRNCGLDITIKLFIKNSFVF